MLAHIFTHYLPPNVGLVYVYCARGQLGVPLLIYLFICWSSRVGVFLIRYYYIVPCTSNGGISASSICHLWGFISIDRHIGRHKLHKLPLVISEVFHVALIFVCCGMFTVNDSEVIDCSHELTLLLSSISFCRRECPCSRRRPTVPKLNNSNIFHLSRCILIYWYIGRRTQVSFCYLGGIFCNSLFYKKQRMAKRIEFFFAILLYRRYSRWIGGSWLYARYYFLEFFCYI